MSRRTIQSPGVEIREIDLTQRPAEPLGTSVFIPGFANQGPTDEVLNVGTFADSEEIYGKPTNAAERYFYHSVKQTFNSDANVYVSRLPYGSGDGISSGTNKYTALVYPVVAAKTIAINAANGGVVSDTAGQLEAASTVAGDTVHVEIISQDTDGKVVYTSFSDTNDTAGTSPNGFDTQLSSISANTLIKGVIFDGAGGSDASSLNAELSSSDYYVIGNPTALSLTETEYNNIKDGNFSWTNNGNTGHSKAFNASDFDGAGIIVLNKAKTTINQDYEGYYVGLLDGVNMNPSTDFDGVLSLYSPVSAGSHKPAEFTTVPTAKLDFTLSASSTSNGRNMSRTLEEVPRFNIQGAEFVDTLSLGVFKVRITPFANDTLNLNYFLAEGYTGSLNSYRKIQNENGGERKSFFLEEQDDKSSNINVLVNPYISKYDGDWTSSLADAPKKFVRTHKTNGRNVDAAVQKGLDSKFTATSTNYNENQGVYGLGSYLKADITSKDIGSIPLKLDRVFEIASNVDQFVIDVSIEAGLGTIFTTVQNSTKVLNGAKQFEDTEFLDLGAYDLNSDTTGFYTINENMVGASSFKNIRDNYRAVFNKFEQFARETRKDHIFIADPIRQIFVQGDNGKILDDKSKNFSTHVYWPLRHQFGFANSNYATVYANWIRVYDAVADKQVWVPFSGNAAGMYARNDANFAPWYAPAGYTRGIVSAANDIAIAPTQRQRDQLYRIAMNPVTKFPNEGTIVFGQKTLQRKPTAFDRVNVRRLFLDLEKRTKETIKYFIFEPNTFLTRTKVVNTLTPIFENCKQTEGIYDYLIVCDERNNPSSRIENNELVVDIYLKPVRAAEFILVNFYAVNNDVNFEELINQ